VRVSVPVAITTGGIKASTARGPLIPCRPRGVGEAVFAGILDLGLYGYFRRPPVHDLGRVARGLLPERHDRGSWRQLPRRRREGFVDLQLGFLRFAVRSSGEEVGKGFLLQFFELFFGEVLSCHPCPLFSLLVSPVPVFPATAFFALVAIAVSVSVARVAPVSVTAVAVGVSAAAPASAPAAVVSDAFLVPLAASLVAFLFAIGFSLFTSSTAGVSLDFALSLGLLALLFGFLAFLAGDAALGLFDLRVQFRQAVALSLAFFPPR
jgi:hypothetical protein